MNQTSQQRGQHSSFENYDLVSDPERIAGVLDEINRHLVLVSVRLDSEGPLYDSHLARVDPDQKVFYLDELEPAAAQTQLATGQDIYVFATMRGIAVRFASAVDQVLGRGSATQYVCGYPEQVLYLQRRDLFRVQLPRYEERTVKIRCCDDDREVVARVADISVKGFCLEAKSSEIGHHQVGLEHRYYAMDLPDSRTPLSGDAVLVNLRPSPTPGLLSAGFAIKDLDPLTERSLMRAALHYQRDAKKQGG